ncbi:MAG: cytochrome c oxidase subunit 3 [Acidobacteriota bacterium]|nr:cytochrome c oxidase subunit 3 [Acidobacteriota bacterium]
MPTLTPSNIGAPPPVFPELPMGGGGGDDRDKPPRGGSRQASITGILVLMCASTMTFAALVSAMVVRRGLNSDWHKFPLPHILWWNTAILIASSVVFDTARRLMRRNRRFAFNVLWSVGTALGFAFLAGQIVAWKQLAERGVFIQGNPGSAFFHVLTWSHAAHVVGALIAVGYVEFRALRYELGPSRRTFVDVTAIFWHFLDVLWVGIMGLFVFWA